MDRREQSGGGATCVGILSFAEFLSFVYLEFFERAQHR